MYQKATREKYPNARLRRDYCSISLALLSTDGSRHRSIHRALAMSLHCTPRRPWHRLLALLCRTNPPSYFLLFWVQKLRRHLRSRGSSKPCRSSSSQVGVVDGTDDEEACELVSGVDVIIGEGGDSISAYLLKAVKNNNGTGILLLSDILGFEDSSTRDFAYRVACNGYNVLVPDLFRGDPWKKGQPTAADFEQWLGRHPAERVARDINLSVGWLVDGFAVAGLSKKLGIIGFCYGGGRLVETLARDAGTCFSAGVCFYGAGMDASLGSRVRAPVLFVCGDGDPYCPVSTVLELERSIHGSKAVVYEGRGHSFAHRPQSQEEDRDADDAFALMRSWLHDLLLVDQ